MKLYIIISILLSVFILNAQPSKQFKFKNHIPLWSHSSIVEEFKDQIFAYRPMSPFIIDNNIYLSHNIQKSFFGGYIVEKISLDTGELVWKYHYLTNENVNREYAQNPYVDDSGLLKILIFKEKKKSAGLPWWDALLSQRTLDPISGEVINYFVTDSVDSLNFILDMPISPFNYFKSTSSLYPIDDDFLYIKRKGLGTNISYRYIKLNNLGHIISDTLISRRDSTLGLNLIRFISSKELENSTTMVLEHYINFANPKYPFTLKNYKINRQGDISDELDISSSVQPAYQFNLEFVNKDYFIVSGIDSVYTSGALKRRNIYYLFSTEGNLIEKVVIKDKENNVYFTISQPIILNNKKNMFFGICYDKENHQNLLFLKSNGGGKLDTLKKLVVDSDSDKIAAKLMYPIGNNRLLINFSHLNTQLENKAYKSVWIMFDNKEIGLPTATKEYQVELNKIIIFPNPLGSILNINLNKRIKGEIFIYDKMGRNIIHQKIDSKQKVINVKKLTVGVYKIKKISNSGEIYFESFIKS